MSPIAPLRPCPAPRCTTLGPCATHARERERTRRPEWITRFYSSTAWKKLRARKRRQDPLCQDCSDKGIVTPMREVDHVIPLTERPDLALDMSNLRSLCSPCHAAKTSSRHALGA